MKVSVTSWLIETALFKSLAPGQRRTDSFELGLELATADEAREILELKGGDRVEF
jgi:hypothetical protein